jgi:uncharacterized glyoxalase superfamily protein PhnB
MASTKKGSKARGAKAPARRRSSKTTTKAKPAPKAGRAKPGATQKKAAAKRPAAKSKRAAPRARGPAAAPARRMRPRHQPETLRCKPLMASLTVDDLDASMRFYVDGLGFHVRERWEREGTLRGVEMVAGSAMIGISQDDWAKGRNRTKGVGMRFYLETTQDIDEVAARIQARGVEVRGPEDAPWGARLVHVTDPDGFQLTLYQERKG